MTLTGTPHLRHVFLLVSSALALLIGLAPAARANSGGPNDAGYEWRDNIAPDNCPFVDDARDLSEELTFRDGPFILNYVGPIDLGFQFPYYGQVVSNIWINQSGLIFFDEPPNMGFDAAGTLGSPTDPNGMIAAHWANHAHLLTSGSYQSFGPGGFKLRYEAIAEPCPDTIEFELYLFPTGQIRIEYLDSPGAGCPGPTIGIENFDGGLELVLMNQGGASPGFSFGVNNYSVCIERNSLLEFVGCDGAVDIGCGDSYDGTTPMDLPFNVERYGCTTSLFSGNEVLHRLTVDELSDVTVDLTGAGGLAVFLLATCNEFVCIDGGTASAFGPALAPGEYHVVVDGPLGGNQDYTLDVTCTPLASPLACGESVGGVLGGFSRIDGHRCVAGDFPGPEAYYVVDVAEGQNLLAELTASPGQAVAIYPADVPLRSENCLTGGTDSAVLFAPDPGRYLVVVDGANVGPFGLQVFCDPLLDCVGATEVSCAQTFSGNTFAGTSAVSLYSCTDEQLDGNEVVYRFFNPVEQTINARFLFSQPGQRLLLATACSEGECLLIGDTAVSCSNFPPGEYFLIVDGLAGANGAFDVAIDCNQFLTGIDLQLTSIDASGLTGSCEDFDVDGMAQVVVSNLGTVDITTDFEVIVFQDDPMAPNGAWDPATDTELGRTTFNATPAMPFPAGQSRFVDVPSMGTLVFRDNVIYAVVDPDGVSGADLEPLNNVFDTGRSCDFRPPIDEFTPAVEWHFDTPVTQPTYVEVDTTPVVGDVNADGWPDIAAVFGIEQFDSGFVRLLDGRDGAEHWISNDIFTEVYSSSNIAIAELDGDPGLEVVGHSNLNTRSLVVIDDDGRLVGNTAAFSAAIPVINLGGGAPSIGDIDADGQPEIVFGNNAFNTGPGLGTVFWVPDPAGVNIGANNAGGETRDGALSVMVDVDNDGELEVVAGPTAYKWDGAGNGDILWTQDLAMDGYPAIGNFDQDEEPEVVIVAEGRVYLLEGDTGDLIWQANLPVGGGGCTIFGPVAGGPPTVADFDGDCQSEVGVAGADQYAVLETNGDVRWRSPIDDCSSNRTASSVFDFDGDGAAEVAFLDETAFRVFDGTTGFEIVALPAASHTWLEMIAVADVDADNNAEIVVPLNPCFPTNPNCDGLRQSLTGIQVIGDADDNWVNTRRIWNQHTYHINNVNDDGTVPTRERDSWLDHNTYRDQIGTAIFSASDLTLSITSLEIEAIGECEREVVITARVGNGGGVSVGRMTEASVYLQEGATLTWLETAPIRDLQPGEFEDVVIRVPPPRFGDLDILVCADDDATGMFTGAVNECREDNNCCVATVTNDDGGGGGGAAPPRVGNALRPAVVSHDPLQIEEWVEFVWDLDEGAPRMMGDEYRLKRSEDPSRVNLTITPMGHVDTFFRDDPPPVAVRPHVYFYKVFAANSCGIEEDQEVGP
ncbi:MAG: CARDB domain-containing protein [Acidobacteriota bacterium]